jgi:hypothetical protein
MKILKTAEESYHMTLAPTEARIFINCMKATFDGIGDWEYSARMGATRKQIEDVVASLEAALN